MFWLILEDALRDNYGHYREYISTFRRGLLACGDKVRIACDSRAEPWLIRELDLKPVLPQSIWHRMSDKAPRWRKLLRYPFHGISTFLAWRRIVLTNGPADFVFAPSVLIHHLLGIVPFLLLYGRRLRGKVILFFPNTPICYSHEANASVLAPEFTAKCFPMLVRFVRPLVNSRKVILGVETHAMREALTSITGLPFVYFPHPVEIGPNVTGHDLGDAICKRESSDTIVLGSYGGTRYEKGADLLQAAIRNYLEDSPDPRARFVLQWTEDFHDKDGKLIQRDPWLERHPQVRFLTDLFEEDGGYRRQLLATDVLLLPYRESYRYRLSRVVIEAMICGKPVVVPHNTTLLDQAAEYGALVACHQEDAGSLSAAIRTAIKDYDDLRANAAARAMNCAKHFSVLSFRRFALDA